MHVHCIHSSGGATLIPKEMLEKRCEDRQEREIAEQQAKAECMRLNAQPVSQC